MTHRASPRPDPRELPAYTMREAAHYLGVPQATLRSWCLGQTYSRGGRRRFFKPVIEVADAPGRLLSFLNLVEAHVLSAIRRQHEVSLQKVRKALSYLARTSPSRHPLADRALATDGLTLFLDQYGSLVDLSRDGQLVMRKVLEAYLSRVERDSSGDPIRLYPFTRRRDLDEPRAIVIDPHVSFGRPVLAGTGIPTAVIADRLKAGETIDELAKDYGRDVRAIEEAIRCELQAA